ncbi:ARID DNA-binding domain-containing protein [Tanacetum coccineum]|uniref:ARID DNA-binding domain-containing protein n=1 Tax=Tanacetum coccineum TaxID=301880 RepID=A0ABQ5BVH4_9ASTR
MDNMRVRLEWEIANIESNMSPMNRRKTLTESEKEIMLEQHSAELEYLTHIEETVTCIDTSWEDLNSQIERGKSRISWIISDLHNIKEVLIRACIKRVHVLLIWISSTATTWNEANWSYKPKGSGQNQQWYQSKSWKPLRKMSQREFTQRQIKREKEERIGRGVRQITRSCKDMLKKKLEEVKAFNSSILQDRHKRNKCFYCRERWHFIRTCPKKISDDAESADKHSDASLERKKEINSAQPKVSLKYSFTSGQMESLKEQIKALGMIFDIGLSIQFKEPIGNILDLNKLRQMKNNFLEDYFEGLNENKDGKKDEMVRIEEDMNSSEVHTFHEFVAFLNLIKNDELVSKGWDFYWDRFVKVLKWFYSHYLQRQLPGPIPPIIHGIPIHLFDLYKLIEYYGGYLSVDLARNMVHLQNNRINQGREWRRYKNAIGLSLDILSLITDHQDTRRSCIYKAEEVSSLIPTKWNIVRHLCSLAVQKREEKLVHFGIKTRRKKFCKEQNLHYYGEDQIHV